MTDAAPSRTADPLDPQLQRLAAAHGVATEFQDWSDTTVQVGRDAVVAVLHALGVAAHTEQEITTALAEAELAPWRFAAPAAVVGRAGTPLAADLRLPPGPLAAVLLTEGGQRRELAVGADTDQREVDGRRLRRCTVELPHDLPPGDHRLEVALHGDLAASIDVVIAPAHLELPAGAPGAWGWMVQLYALRSARSWGAGDLGDLAELVRWAGADQGAGLLLVNPLHLVAPVHPVERSPYTPSSRRFANVATLAVERVRGYPDGNDAELRAQLDRLGEQGRALNAAELIDHDAVWEVKSQALEALWAAGVGREVGAEPEGADEPGLDDVALFCALAERHGRRFPDWPQELRRPGRPAVEQARTELADRVAYHRWLQRETVGQLMAAQQAARAAGMPIGVVHDLAVGVDPGGADAWALQDDLALGASVGAPPDSFNQLGQDWGLPPLHPARLRETGYRAFRDIVRAVLRLGGGLRVDHVMGLSRLWWVPAGSTADLGSYVRYDLDAMLAILCLEAWRCGATVVAEDLGTVEPAVETALAASGVLGSAVLWFERDDDAETPLPPARWRPAAMASVSTHDLPTAAGFLTGEHVRVRAELGQLGRPVAEEQQSAAAERAALLGLLADEGLLPPEGSAAPVAELVLALHGLLARSPCQLVLAQPGDAVGDRRQPNLPGTVDSYPNWRLPVAGPDGVALSLEQWQAHPGVARLAGLLAARGGDHAPQANDHPNG